MDRRVITGPVFASVRLNDVDLGAGLRPIGELVDGLQPERRPSAISLRKLCTHLEVAVALSEALAIGVYALEDAGGPAPVPLRQAKGAVVEVKGPAPVPLRQPDRQDAIVGMGMGPRVCPIATHNAVNHRWVESSVGGRSSG
jgi:hypothetical protein